MPRAGSPARIGEVALVFYVASMADTLAVLRAAGASWSPDPKLFVLQHRAQQEACLREPDGAPVDLVA